MVLSENEIERRLRAGEIFTGDSWEPNAIKEASYALRVAPDGMLVDGEYFDPGSNYPSDTIRIEPGKIAVLSTIERLSMPPDLVGKIGIRFDYAIQGLTGLMGIQVDPLYGEGVDQERLYVRVANLGNDPVRINVGDQVFTFELHTMTEPVIPRTTPRINMWDRMRSRLAGQSQASWTYVTSVQNQLTTETDRIRAETANIRESLQPLILFGVFLLSITILGVALSVLLSLRYTPQAQVPTWITSWAWGLLWFVISVASLAITIIGATTAWAYIRYMRGTKFG